MDAISKTLDSIVSLKDQASQRTSYYKRHLILESLLSDHKKAKTMLNDCESALADNMSKDLFGNKFEEKICRNSKTKTKSKNVFEGSASSNQPFRGGAFPSRGGRGRGNRGFAFIFKGLNFTRGKKFVSTTSHKFASSSRPSPGSSISEVFVSRGSSVPVPNGRKVKVFSEKSGEIVQRPSSKKYDFGLQGSVFGSTLSRQIPEASADAQREISVGGYRNPDTLRERANQNDRFKSGQIFELHLFIRKERFKPEASH